MLDSLQAFFTTYDKLLAGLAHLATILGGLSVPAGLVAFFRAKRKERQAKEYETYDALDDKYIELQRLCIEYPELSLHETAQPSEVPLGELDQKRQRAAFAILFSIFERAYFMFENQSTPLIERQREGWVSYMRHYFQRQDVRAAWKLLNVSGQFDKDFYSFVERELLSDQVPG